MFERLFGKKQSKGPQSIWPQGVERTAEPKPARFTVDRDRVRDEVAYELRLLGATDVQLGVEGHAVAAWFRLEGEQRCIPCDRWAEWHHNAHAIALTVSALRGIERWGTREMVEASMKGFGALMVVPDGEVTEPAPSLPAVRFNSKEEARLVLKTARRYGENSQIYRQAVEAYKATS